MKRFRTSLITMLLLILVACFFAPAAASPGVTIQLLSELPTHLEVGESVTIDIRVTSDEPYIFAMSIIDAYYPGRGVYSAGVDHVPWAPEVVLHQTITGKKSTADLQAVTDWPATEDWPAGVAPLSLVVGVRKAGGVVVSEQFTWAVAVP